MKAVKEQVFEKLWSDSVVAAPPVPLPGFWEWQQQVSTVGDRVWWACRGGDV